MIKEEAELITRLQKKSTALHSHPMVGSASVPELGIKKPKKLLVRNRSQHFHAPILEHEEDPMDSVRRNLDPSDAMSVGSASTEEGGIVLTLTALQFLRNVRGVLGFSDTAALLHRLPHGIQVYRGFC